MSTAPLVYTPIGQTSRAEQVVERLSNAIVVGLLEAESQLPNEAELSRLMGVSPVTVREALNTLRERGLIDTRRGRNGGSFVCQVSTETMFAHHPLRLMTSAYIADLGEFHSALVGHSARLAAQRSMPSESKRLNELIDTFASEKQPDARTQADMRCLLTIAAHAQSPRLANQELEIQAEWVPLLTSLYQNDETHAEAVAAYRSIQQALHSADALAAYVKAQDMIAMLTDRLLAHKLKLNIMQKDAVSDD
ncbi:FadR/GntR family transcriptional regulator [Xenorhabdus szentirmaii]|uniref:FadR/GntR family transcriptional regulator n=1 Tax=Xenorhabdus szentirmaii TaxID=290112 RepID=UPI001999E810|nr:GntR family transcriptional regulator [Xenorhabdus sp. 38]MBD2782826.1 FadR family transcriptional regulator [Xenorhabdus sp. 38]